MGEIGEMSYLITLYRRPENEQEFGPVAEYAVTDTIGEGEAIAQQRDWRFIQADEITPVFKARYLREVDEFIGISQRWGCQYDIPKAAYMLMNQKG